MRFMPILVALLAFACSSPDPEGSGLKLQFSDEFHGDWAEVLTGSERLELVAIDPDPPTKAERGDPDRMHGYRIRGRAWLEDPKQRAELLGAFARGDRQNDHKAAACFNPRHVLRAEKGGRWIEVVICFECLSYQVYDGAEHLGNGLVSQSPTAVFNRVFESMGLSIAGRNG